MNKSPDGAEATKRACGPSSGVQDEIPGLTAAFAAMSIALLAAVCMPQSAYAQRCPAGQDQFMNCLPLSGPARTRHEQWANQPAAYQIPGARPYGAAQTNSPQQGAGYNCKYRRALALIRAGDPRQMRIA